MAAPAPSADIWHSLFNFYLTSAITISAVVFAIMIYVLIRYRSRGEENPGDPEYRIGDLSQRGSVKVAIALTIILGVLFLGLTTSTFSAMEFMEEIPEDNPDALHIKVLAFQWGWRFTYPNGKTLTGELRVPAGVPVILEITSQDVFHTFSIPAFKVKKDAIPGRINYAWFEGKYAGEYTIRCYELCGVGHAEMLARLLVMEPEQFEKWYEEFSSKG